MDYFKIRVFYRGLYLYVCMFLYGYMHGHMDRTGMMAKLYIFVIYDGKPMIW